MSDELEQVDLATNESQTETVETQEEQPTESVEDLKAKLEAEAVARRQLTARAKAAEEKNAQYEQKKQLKTEDTDIKSTVQSLKLAEDKRQFGYEHNLSPVEVDAIFKVNPNPTKETLEDPFVKGGLSAVRSKGKVENNIPRASRGNSPLASRKKLSEMTPNEKQDAFEKRRDNVLSKRK